MQSDKSPPVMSLNILLFQLHLYLLDENIVRLEDVTSGSHSVMDSFHHSLPF